MPTKIDKMIGQFLNKPGFTLIELLVVVGIMGMLATVSIGGYTAVTRGMAERGALDAATGIAKATLQRAQIDQTKTYLYLFNEVLKLDSDDDVGVVCGVAIAVRPVGRFTRIVGDVLYDEFGDLNQSYGSLDRESEEESDAAKEKSASTMRIYRPASGDFATVREGVYFDDTSQAIDLEPDSVTDPAKKASGDEGTGRIIAAYGFKTVSGASFQVGDMYAQEFAVMRLPPGYVFSSSVTLSSPSDLGLHQVGSPKTVNATDTSEPSLEVFSRRPDGSFKSIGMTSQVKDIKR